MTDIGRRDAANPDEPLEARWHALGTTVHVLVAGHGSLELARRAVVRVLADVDATYSRFRSDSELSVLNSNAGHDMLVSPLLSRAIAVALRAARLTGGAVDPTIGRTLRLLGYDDDFARLSDHGHGGSTAPTFGSVAGWEAVRFDPVTRRVRVPRGVELDLGATGKGLAADLAAEAALDAMGDGGVLVSLGGDIATDGTPPDGGWRVHLAEDSAAAPDGPGEVIRIMDGGLATSSTTLRRWTRGGVVRHHLVDPTTGLPAEGPWRTATVAAANAVDANVASTAAIVMGEGAPAWLERHDLAARLVAQDGRIVRVAGWPAGADDPEGPAGPAGPDVPEAVP